METREFKLGTLTDGGRVLVDARLEAVERPARAITHERLDSYVKFAISGGVYYGRGMECGGQIQDILKIANWAKGTDRARVRRVLALWERWHLNDMRPGCVHQIVGPYSEAYAAEQTANCPQGYKYGSAWLVEPLPADVLRDLCALFFPEAAASDLAPFLQAA